MKETVLVDRAFKLKFGLKLCLLVIAGMLASTLFVFFITAKEVGGTYSQAIYTIYDLKINIFTLLFASFYSIFILAVVSVAIAAVSMLYSHKIAGPLFRIEKNIEAIGAGDLTVTTKFRGNDQLSSLADEINAAVRSLNHIARNSTELLDEIERRKERLETLLRSAEPDEKELGRALEELGAAVESVKKAASTVKS